MTYLLLLTLLSGCASSPPAPPEPLASSVTLMASQSWIKDVELELFRDFEDETGIHVNVLLTPDNAYETLLDATFAGGSSTVDLFMFPAGTKMRSSGISRVVLDLSGEPWADRLQPWAVKANTDGDRLLGCSIWGSDWEAVLYNRSLFEEQGWTIPTTWEDFLALCDAIQAAGIAPLYESINSVHHTEAWLNALTYPILREEKDCVSLMNVNQLQFRDLETVPLGLKQIQQFFSHKPAYFLSDGRSEDWLGSYDALLERRAAMMLTYSAYADELRALGSEDQWGMFPLPLLDSTVAVTTGPGISKFINKHSAHIEESLLLLDFLARDENLERYYGARPDLINPSFSDIENTSYEMEAAVDLMAHITDMCPDKISSSILYWDPGIYLYMQGFVDGSMTPDQFIDSMDRYRSDAFRHRLPTA